MSVISVSYAPKVIFYRPNVVEVNGWCSLHEHLSTLRFITCYGLAGCAQSALSHRMITLCCCSQTRHQPQNNTQWRWRRAQKVKKQEGAGWKANSGVAYRWCVAFGASGWSVSSFQVVRSAETRRPLAVRASAEDLATPHPPGEESHSAWKPWAESKTPGTNFFMILSRSQSEWKTGQMC